MHLFPKTKRKGNIKKKNPKVPLRHNRSWTYMFPHTQESTERKCTNSSFRELEGDWFDKVTDLGKV